MGSHFRAGIDEKFRLRSRRNHRANVASVEHGAGRALGRMGSEFPLIVQ